MNQRFITVLKSLSAPPRADFMYAAVQSKHFTIHELRDMFGDECLRDTLSVALEYIEVGSIIVLPSKREPYQKLLAHLDAARAQRTFPGVESAGTQP